jgi:glycosyltransferase involved in cell wall biosynthesis
VRILYIGNWALKDGLTQATVLPHLSILLQGQNLESLVFVTIERSGVAPGKPDCFTDERLHYAPLVSKGYSVKLFNQLVDLVLFPKQIGKLLDDYKIDKVIARGSPAGGVIYKVCSERGIPFFVESFEPHSLYMLESGVWKWWDPKFLLQKKWEQSLKRNAAGLMPVARKHKELLVEEGVSASRLAVCPCSVDMNKFQFKKKERARVRKEFGIPEDALVGIYVGKFGGYYFNDEAFLLYRQLMAAESFWLILVSPDDPASIQEKASMHQLPLDKIKIISAKHDEVADYLSAADFAFATVKPSPSKRFLSLIKIGEYWACGLPIIITENIGDDSEFIEQENIGVVLKNDWSMQSSEYFVQVMHALNSMMNRERIRTIAEQRRSMQNIVTAYRYFELI